MQQLRRVRSLRAYMLHAGRPDIRVSITSEVGKILTFQLSVLHLGHDAIQTVRTALYYARTCWLRAAQTRPSL